MTASGDPVPGSATTLVYPTATRAGARGRTPTGQPGPEPPVSTSSVFPWTPSSQTMEPLGNPGRFSCSHKTYKVRCLLVPSLDPSLPTGLHRTIGVVGGRTSAGSRRVSCSFQACDRWWSAGDQHHFVADSLLPDSRSPAHLGGYSIHGRWAYSNACLCKGMRRRHQRRPAPGAGYLAWDDRS